MVLASVKLSMPGGEPAKKRKRRFDASSIPGVVGGSQDPSGGPRTRRKSSSSLLLPCASTAAAERRTTLEEEFQQLSRGDGVTAVTRGGDPAPRLAQPLRIKLSLSKHVASRTAFAGQPGVSRNENQRGTVKSGIVGVTGPDIQLSGASDDAPVRDYRSLIEEHRNKEIPSSGGGDGHEGSGLWVCRHCGARRKEGKRGAALSNLLSHLRSCVKSDVVEEYLNLQGKSANKKSAPAEKSALATTRRKAKPTKLDESCASGLPLPPRITPAKSDVCLGDGSNRGYRLLKDAVKGVRMGVDEENWEYIAVSQTLEGLRRVHRHPNRRFLIRSPGNGWVEASETVVRKKIIALYRRYFRFKSSKIAADPFPASMNYNNAGAPFRFDDDPFAVFEETDPPRSGTNLDAGIIRHALIEDDVSLPVPGVETGPRGSNRPGPFEVSASESSAASMDDGAQSPSSQHATATCEDEPAVERSWESSVYKEVQTKIAAKWYTLEQEREQRAVLLEQQMGELRSTQATHAERKALVESAHARYAELAASAGVEVEGWASSTTVDMNADLHTTDTRKDGEAEDGLTGRIKRRLVSLKAEIIELDKELAMWKERTAELENLIHALDRPTEDYLRANARLAELEAQAEDLLTSEIV